MLTLDGIDAHYGNVQVLRGMALEARAGEILCLLGRNGAGKTTTLKTVMGLVRARSGRVTLEGEDITALPAHEIPGRGIGYVPQGRRLFAEMTVAENLEIGLMARGRDHAVRDHAVRDHAVRDHAVRDHAVRDHAVRDRAVRDRAVRNRMLDLFPVLRDRLKQVSGTLSGGEQQMLAMARALCLEPRVLLLDEPTEGLQPSMIALIRDVVTELRGSDTAVILVEQRVEAVLSIADRVLFIENGSPREALDAATLRADPSLVQRYVGIG